MSTHRRALAGALALIVGLQAATSAWAVSCREELQRFERRLQTSSLAETDPGAFQALLRRTEEAAQLRDEYRCLQRVAELHEALPEDDPLPPAAG